MKHSSNGRAVGTRSPLDGRQYPMRRIALALVACASAVPACAPRAATPPPVSLTVTAPAGSSTPAVTPLQLDALAAGEQPPLEATAPSQTVTPDSSSQRQELPPLPSPAPLRLVPATLARQLSNGLPFNLIVEVELVAPGSPATRHAAGACSVSFDLWDEVYRVRLSPGAGASPSTVATSSVAGVIRACADRQAYADALNAAPGAVAREWVVQQKP